MYSVVLMMALTGGAEVPASHGGHGCYGGTVVSNGCYGGGHRLIGNGCHGGGHRWFGGGGCYGGNGCYGGGHRLFGHGCNGGLFGRHGCYGGSASYGCYGGSAYYGCTGGTATNGCYGGRAMPAETAPPPRTKDAEKLTTPPQPKAAGPAPAIIVVTLPVEAKLTVDDNPTSSTSAVRVFSSPALEPGKEFSYTLKGELVREGQTVTATKVVQVRAGQETRVTMEFPAQIVAQR